MFTKCSGKMKKIKILSILISVMLVIVSVFTFQVLACEEERFDLDITLTAGCSVERCIKIKNTQNSNLHFKIKYTISPDSEGISLDIPKNIVIQKRSTKNVCFTIDTSPLLMPQDYHITITVYKVKDK